MKHLSDLKPGDTARVTGIEPGTESEHQTRMMEMGLLPGTTVRVVRVAPFGDPVDIEVRGYHLSLRSHSAKSLQVEEIEG